MDKSSQTHAINELRTLGDLLRFGVTCAGEKDLTYGHGTDNAWDEMLALVFPTLNLPLTVASQVFNARLTRPERKKIITLMAQRIEEKIPVAYLTKTAYFAGLSFYVDKRVIIPRSPIAELIEAEFSPWISPPPKRVLDLCTGSACLAILMAHIFEHTHIDAIDLSESALEVAKINVEKYDLASQVHLIQSDLFDACSQNPDAQYDIIISNPPYVDAQEMAGLPEEFLHEPTLALAAGEQGLSIVDKILKDAKKYLKPDGILIVEVGNSAPALETKYPNLPFIWLDFERGGDGVFLLKAKDL